jgi:hypothetical protein
MDSVSAGELAGIGWPVTGSIVPGEASGARLSTGEAARIPKFSSIEACGSTAASTKQIRIPFLYIFTDG